MSFQPLFGAVSTPNSQTPVHISPLYDFFTSNISNAGIMPAICSNTNGASSVLQNNRAMMAGGPMISSVPASALKLPTMHMSTPISNPRFQLKENSIPSPPTHPYSVQSKPSETDIKCPIPSVISPAVNDDDSNTDDEHSSLNKKPVASYDYKQLLLQHDFIDDDIFVNDIDLHTRTISSSSTSVSLTIHHINGSPCIPTFIPHPPALQSCIYNNYGLFHENESGLQNIDVVSFLLQKRLQNKIPTDLQAVEKKRFLERTPVAKAVKPKTGYHYFAKDIREHEPEQIQGYSASTQSKMISIRWKKLDRFTKDRYLKLGDPEKKAYAEQNEKYKKYVEEAKAVVNDCTCIHMHALHTTYNIHMYAFYRELFWMQKIPEKMFHTRELKHCLPSMKICQ